MSEQSLTPEELTWQVQKHLQSLKEAGVEWLPKGSPPIPDADRPALVSAGPTRTAVAAEQSSPELFVPEAPPELPMEQRRIELDLLAEQVSTCSRCTELTVSRTKTVFGEGPLDADLCFIGEAPGYNEDQQGRPFVGEAGQLLDRILAACGFKREEVYICNILKCRPPGNRTPLLTEAAHCRSYLEQQLELIRPKYICAMGACAAQNLLGTTQSITRMRRRFHDFKGTPVLCTYHPAYLLRNPQAKKDVWEDMKLLLQKMGREIPKR